MKMSDITWKEFTAAYCSRKASEHNTALKSMVELLEVRGEWQVIKFSTTKSQIFLRSTKWMHTLEGVTTTDFNQVTGDFIIIELDMPSCYMRVEAFREYGTINMESVLASKLSGYPNPMRKEGYSSEKQLESFLNAAEKVAKPFCFEFVGSFKSI